VIIISLKIIKYLIVIPSTFSQDFDEHTKSFCLELLSFCDNIKKLKKYFKFLTKGGCYV
jgi:hypothetical protein